MSDPLSGASIFIIVQDDLDEADAGGKSNGGEVVKATVAALGGRLCSTLEDATHAIWVSSTSRDGGSPTGRAREMLTSCQSLNIPVVEPSWLERSSGLLPDEHWSEVDVGSHVPAVVADLPPRGEDRLPSVAWTRPQQQAMRRRDATAALDRSLADTWRYLFRENPEVVEEDQLRRALELSMLDWALVVPNRSVAASETSPWDVLGVRETASVGEIKRAYKRKARTAHPDKGGSTSEFATLALAYRTLLRPARGGDETAPRRLRSTAERDAELRDHRSLVNALFEDAAAAQGAVERQRLALTALGLRHVEAGATIPNAADDVAVTNCCFYLSLATGYLAGIGALDDETRSPDPNNPTNDDRLRNETALRLKRLIEAAVLAAHPEWASSGQVGDDVQAFSDFLVFVLEGPTIVADLAVAVFDTVSGFVDIYKGAHYDDSKQLLDAQRANFLTLRFVPGHYQPLLPLDPANRPTLDDALQTLNAAQVLYIVTEQG